MKAEHRKELETNTLADKMGQAMKRVKTSPRRTFVTYLFIILALLVGMFLLNRWWKMSSEGESDRWVKLYDGASHSLESLAQTSPSTQAGKAARFQLAWMYYWDGGVKLMGNDSAGALQVLNQVSKRYKVLAEECSGDAIFEPQALLGMAVVEETKAIESPKDHLGNAKELYAKVVEKYKDTVEGKFAQGRLDLLKDERKRAEITSIYEQLQRILNVRPANINFPAPPIEKEEKKP